MEAEAGVRAEKALGGAENTVSGCVWEAGVGVTAAQIGSVSSGESLDAQSLSFHICKTE